MNIKERPTIAMTAIESSQIAAIGHDAWTNTLAIQFKSGGLYHYENFDQELFDAFRNATSIGSHFYKHIKPHTDKFPYARIEARPAAAAA